MNQKYSLHGRHVVSCRICRADIYQHSENIWYHYIDSKDSEHEAEPGKVFATVIKLHESQRNQIYPRNKLWEHFFHNPKETQK